MEDNDDPTSIMLGERVRSPEGRRDSAFSAVFTTSIDGESIPCSEPGDIFYSTRSDLNIRSEEEPSTSRPRLKSCPKLLYLNRKTPRAKRKGVRWKVMDKRHSDPPNPGSMFRDLILLPGEVGFGESERNFRESRLYDASPFDYNHQRKNVSFQHEVMGSQRSFESYRSTSPRVIPKICNDTYRLTRIDPHSTGAVPKSHRSRGIELPPLRGVSPSRYAAALATPSLTVSRSLPDINFQQSRESPTTDKTPVVITEAWTTASLDGEDLFFIQEEAALPKSRLPEAPGVHKPLHESRENRQLLLPIVRRKSNTPTESQSSESVDKEKQQDTEGRSTDDSKENKHHSRWKDVCWP